MSGSDIGDRLNATLFVGVTVLAGKTSILDFDPEHFFPRFDRRFGHHNTASIGIELVDRHPIALKELSNRSHHRVENIRQIQRLKNMLGNPTEPSLLFGLLSQGFLDAFAFACISGDVGKASQIASIVPQRRQDDVSPKLCPIGSQTKSFYFEFFLGDRLT